MQPLTKLLVVAFIGLLISCSKEQSSKAAREELSRVESSYCSADIRVAETALVNHLQTLSEEETNHVNGIDYDMARVIAHERLFLIYRKKRDTNKMELHFEKSMEYLKRFNEKRGLPPPQNTYQTLASIIERFDQGLDVKWKKE